jgi:hypothetical protein
MNNNFDHFNVTAFENFLEMMPLKRNVFGAYFDAFAMSKNHHERCIVFIYG